MFSPSKKILTQPLRLAVAVIIIGALFKIMHWQGANAMIVSAYAAIVVLYPFRFLNKNPKQKIDYVKLVLVLSWAVSGIFHVLHLPYPLVVNFITLASALAYLVMAAHTDISATQQEPETATSLRPDLIFTAAALITIAGAVFKIMHWQGANIMLITGMLLGVVWVLNSTFGRKE